MSKKEQLITDIQNLLNSYDNINTTKIDKELLKFMDENTLINIIDSLLIQKENLVQANEKWLNKFKVHK